MRKEDIMDVLFIILITVVVIAIISLISITIRKPAPQPTYIDSTQVQVLYTDTWGKIFIMKEEDL